VVAIVALTLGFVAWIILWAIGAKPFDGFLVLMVILLPAAAYSIFAPGIKKMLGGQDPPS